MAIRQPDTLISNNPKAYGIVKAKEVSGHKTVQCLDELYNIPDCILSESKYNMNNDAIGQKWYVISENKDYVLVDWNNRNTYLGWKINEQEIKIDSELSLDSINPVQNKIITSKFNQVDSEISNINSKIGEISEVLDRLISIEL